MTTAVIHGGRVVRRQHLDDIWSRAVHVAPVDAVIVDRPPSLRLVATPRGPGHFERVFEWVEGRRPALEAAVPDESFWRLDGLPLFEAIHYELVFRLSARMHAVWSMELCREELGATTFVFADEGESVGAPPPRPWPARAREWAFEVLDPMRQRLAARSVRNPAGGSAVGTEVIFSEYFPNSVRTVVPVLREVGESGLLLAGRPAVRGAGEGAGVRSVDLARFAPWSSLVMVQRHNAWTRRSLARAAATGIGTGDPRTDSAVGGAVARAVVRCLDRAERLVRWHLAALRSLVPRVVATTTFASIYGGSAALAGRALGIPTAYVQHGILGGSRFYSHFVHDAVLLWGEVDRRAAVANGIDDSRIHVVGSPDYDAVVTRRRGPNRGEVLFLASRRGGAVVSEAAWDRILEVVADSVERVPGAQLRVKLHPADTPRRAREILVRKGLESAIVDQGSAGEAIARAEVIMVVSSTTGLEACAAGRPLLVLRLNNESRTFDYASYGAAVEVRSADELPATLSRVLGDEGLRSRLAEGRRALVADALGGEPGPAARRAAESLRSLRGFG